MTIRAITVSLFALAVVAGCGGGGGAVPNGSTVNYQPSPAAGSTFSPVAVNVSISIPQATSTQRSKIRPQYLSPSTQSITIQLVSVNGSVVPGAQASTIDTYAGAQNCTSAAAGLTCTGTVTGAAGSDVFTINTFSQPRGTGSVLSSGTFASTVANNATISITSATSQSLASQIAAVSVTAVPSSVTLGTATSMKLVVTALDAGNQIIVGPGNYASSVALSITGDTTNAFAFGNGTAAQLLASPSDVATLKYNGDVHASIGSIVVQATTQGATGTLNVSAPVQILPSPTPSPSPTPKATPTPIGATPSPTPTPTPQALIYVLNQGSNSGTSATVTVYHANSNGNVAPIRVLNLSQTLFAVSIAVNTGGSLYVGYYAQNPANGGIVDPGNEIDVYAPTASGNASPLRRIQAENGGTNTLLDPGLLTFDPSGHLVTLGTTALDGWAGGEAVLLYQQSAAGAVAPFHAWNFNSLVAPTIAGFGTVGANPTEIAYDAAGNAYVSGSLLNSGLASTPTGIFIAPSNSVNGGIVAQPREIPIDTTSSFLDGVAIDSGGFIYSSVMNVASAPALNGLIQVYAPGTTGGTTNTTPVRSTTSSALNATYATFIPTQLVAFANGNLYLANESANELLTIPSASSGSVTPTTTISGSATQLNNPIAIAVK